MLVDLTVKEFLNKVAGSDPVPGGGSIAALNGAIASALAAMVANLTIGKKGYELHEELMRHISGVALQQKGAFVEDIDRDSEAYDKVFACFKMPKATDEEKAARSTAIQEATKFAALVPMQVARNAYELMTVIMDVARLGNRNAVTDACVAMMSARSAVLGALMNVRINLGSLKDKEFVSKLQSEADELEHLACAKEKELLDEIAALNGAVASALAAMVANLTIGKKGYEEHEELMKHISEVALQVKDTFIGDIDRDSEAYDSVFACFKMPKATDEEKAARSAAIQEATKFAALVPMQVARNAFELMTVIMDVARLGNRNAVTDACVAMMSARSAVLGALMNVRINLGSLKDKELVAKLQAEADELERLACAKEKELLDEINEELKV